MLIVLEGIYLLLSENWIAWVTFIWLNQFAFRYSVKQKKYHKWVLAYLKKAVTLTYEYTPQNFITYSMDIRISSDVQSFLLSTCIQFKNKNI